MSESRLLIATVLQENPQLGGNAAVADRIESGNLLPGNPLPVPASETAPKEPGATYLPSDEGSEVQPLQQREQAARRRAVAAAKPKSASQPEVAPHRSSNGRPDAEVVRSTIARALRPMSTGDAVSSTVKTPASAPAQATAASSPSHINHPHLCPSPQQTSAAVGAGQDPAAAAASAAATRAAAAAPTSDDIIAAASAAALAAALSSAKLAAVAAARTPPSATSAGGAKTPSPRPSPQKTPCSDGGGSHHAGSAAAEISPSSGPTRSALSLAAAKAGRPAKSFPEAAVAVPSPASPAKEAAADRRGGRNARSSSGHGPEGPAAAASGDSSTFSTPFADPVDSAVAAAAAAANDALLLRHSKLVVDRELLAVEVRRLESQVQHLTVQQGMLQGELQRMLHKNTDLNSALASTVTTCESQAELMEMLSEAVRSTVLVDEHHVAATAEAVDEAAGLTTVEAEPS